MHRLFTLWLWINAVLSGIAVAAPLSVMVFTDLQLIVPRDVSGTLFGGAMGFQLYLGIWLLCALGLGLALLTRMPGARLAWIVAGLVPLLLGAWWRINYPDDADGNLIFSPQAWELDYAMAIGCGLVFSGLYWYRRGRLKPRPVATSADVLLPRTVGALILAGVFLLPPLNFIKQQALPNCAFNKAGQQLTVCLGDDPNEQVIVD
ncbi:MULTISPECIES: hypothetical protein [Pseudomonas]|uniref:Membrane protein n=1 Tax=Pseudomonas chlororaphis subsp. aureofaciens TaxID=587851 RepID=A0AAD1E5M5_9PSED|nr:MULTISPECIES: hypothetical protein [Pseudomonas]AZD98080.1 putative membrane protein [Pseudomonas chlororaphis subsp. aureofaciens]AZE16518.1 putative membrane protein [Pseudomonas chlororaphis subsp. aureofaciens]AZE28926.1 putative membrane protein [Pseudomonas chlororaphis subsp. aureofaciens]AZE35177.1 putative membrane protein [Pseudomonas chlororaphis subsp. aureofaciens]AZE41585.1 putative membrane protein [Pseudomonas chlororaphis subsp. aureofaciens]